MKHRSRKFRDWQKDKHIARKERILKSYLPDGLPKEINASDVLKVYDFLDGFEYREKGKFVTKFEKEQDKNNEKRKKLETKINDL